MNLRSVTRDPETQELADQEDPDSRGARVVALELRAQGEQGRDELASDERNYSLALQSARSQVVDPG